MADTKYPHYELRRINSDGTGDTPEILPVSQVPWDAKASRRGFLGAGIAVSSLALALRDGPVALAAVARQAKSLHAHKKAVLALAFSPDGSLLASGSSDKTAKLWSIPGGRLARTIETDDATAYSLAFAADGTALAVGGTDNRIRIVDADSGLVEDTLKGHDGTVRCLASAPDGDTLVSGSADGTLRLWSWDRRELVEVLSDHTGAVSTIAFSSEGRVMASAGVDRTIRLWLLPEAKPDKVLRGHRSSVSDVVITPADDKLLSRSLSKTIGVWSLPEGKILRVLTGHWAETRHLLLTPAGDTLFTSTGKSVQLWTIPEGQLQATLQGHLGEILVMAVSPDGRTLATGDRYGAVCLWDLQTRTRQAFLFDPASNRPGMDGVTFERRDSVSGNVITYTLPCGAPIPAGATCICNCVPGTYTVSVPQPKLKYKPRNTAPRYRIPYNPGPPIYIPRARSRGTYCACNKICTCIPVCQALRLLHADATVRFMANEVLLAMGMQAHEYLHWAADRSRPELRAHIQKMACKIDEGAGPSARQWPSTERLVAYLGHADDVVSIMAAQLLQRKISAQQLVLRSEAYDRVVRQLREAARRPWYTRDPGYHL